MSKRTTRILATVVSVLLLAGLWWIQGQGDDDSRAAGRDQRSSSTEATSNPQGMPVEDGHGLRYVAVAQLPPEAAETLELIDDGGPFPYPDKDGSTFGNFEGVLPDRQRGYYEEYTVETPGVSHRGARRIVTGDGGEFYWTEDHYESFERVWR